MRDWVHRFNAEGPDGLLDRKTASPTPKLTAEQKAELTAIVEAGPDREKDGVVRWRRVDLKAVIEDRFAVVYHERSVSRLLHELGFSHMGARPRHPAQKAAVRQARFQHRSANVLQRHHAEGPAPTAERTVNPAGTARRA